MMKKKRLISNIVVIVIFLILAIISPNVSASCIIPQNEMIITQNTILCEDTYELAYGIVIGASGVTLDCNNAVIKGFGFGNGIRLEEVSEVTIKDCKIHDYENGIYLKKSSNNQLTNNKLIGNINGIALEDSSSNSLLNNDDKSIETSIVNIDVSEEIVEPVILNTEVTIKEEEEIIEVIKTTKKNTEVKETKSEYDKEITETITNDKNSVKNIVSIRRYNHLDADKSVEITKTRTINDKDDKTTYKTTIKAKEDVKGLVVYEYFPKEVAEHVREINFYEKMILVEEDPIVKKEIGEMKKDEVVTITYDIEKIIKGNQNPSSVVSIEKSNTIISLLSSISYIFAVYIALVLFKRYKADKLLKNFKKSTNKLFGVPFPIAYVILLLIPKVNYSLLLSENCAILFYIIIIKMEFWILYFLVKHKSISYYLSRAWRKVKKN